jgi:hypothetical protein
VKKKSNIRQAFLLVMNVRPKMAHNAPTIGEGGDFNHKSQCVEQVFNIAVNVKRSTAPPILPNVC